MVRANLKGVNTVRKRLADGTVAVYYYHRKTGQPLRGSPGSPEFLKAYADAEKSVSDRLTGTFAQLVRDYLASPEFQRLRESTRREYRRLLTAAEKVFHDLPIAALDDARVRRDFLEWRATIADTSGLREADNRLSVVSAMLTWAVDNGRLTANRLAGFKRLHKADRSELIWLPSDIDAFMAVAPIELQRALVLALHTGQRQGDLRSLTWNSYDGAFIRLRQSKGGPRVVEIPVTSALKRMLDGLERTDVVILTTKTGRPWTADYFKSEWKKARDAAGIEKLHFHDLRGTTVTLLAQAGCSEPQIASITGHSLRNVSSILDRYLARTQELAASAMKLFENAPSTDFANRLQTKPATKATDGAK